jgi:predicted permease
VVVHNLTVLTFQLQLSKIKTNMLDNLWFLLILILFILIGIIYYVFFVVKIPSGATRFNAPSIQSGEVPNSAKKGG